jgi:hypothetical protein
MSAANASIATNEASCRLIVVRSCVNEGARSSAMVLGSMHVLSVCGASLARDILANDTEAARKVAFLLPLGGVDLPDEEGASCKENDDANP